MIKSNENIRNIAIIAHVDHGKTTLVDALFRQSGLALKDIDQDRIMDSGDIERERGITISAKNCAIHWKGVKINIIDTPGHADFGGEVERGLSMVDGVVLLVDSAEGPLPQTRFVLEKALSKSLPVIVVINKIDRIDARPSEVLDEVYDLLLELSNDESMLDVPVFYANGRDGKCGLSPDSVEENMYPLLDAILRYIPAPVYDDEEPFQMLVSDLSYSDFLGRLAVGKVINGTASTNDSLICIKEDRNETLRVTRLQSYDGPTFKETTDVEPGDIIVLSGVNDVSIGDTICTKDEIKASLNDGYLTISAAKGLDKDEQEKESGRYIRRERYAGACQRSFYVGEAVKQEDIKGEFKHGILKLFVPKVEAKKAVEENKYIAIEG